MSNTHTQISPLKRFEFKSLLINFIELSISIPTDIPFSSNMCLFYLKGFMRNKQFI